ncbi:MAG: hypothetical protein AAFQ62_00160 [Pseudomonadota bacterium]
MHWSRPVLIVSAAAFAVAFSNRNDLPGSIAFDAGIDRAPLQRATERYPFQANWDGIDYQIEPEYDYELTGLVVSFRQHDGESRMHRLTEDHLNVADLCVVWGDTARSPSLSNITFWNGIFTCNFSTRDRAAWNAFDQTEVSNNHIIADDARIRDRVDDVRIGDQIRVRGTLAAYISPNGSKRGTSTTRTDTGDGACETIYVDEFEIVARGRNVWRPTMWASLGVMGFGLFGFFSAPHRRHTN